MRNEIIDMLEEKVDEVYLHFQEKLDIKVGDITPPQLIRQSSLIYDLAKEIEGVLNDERKMNMTVQDRMKMIDKKIENDNARELTEKLKKERETNECMEKIKALKDRIKDLLEVAWYAIDNGIKLDNHGFGGHEGYDTGLFFSNGWSHIVGIKDRQFLGITKGGACGNIDFYTDGQQVFGYDTKTKTTVDPLLNDMKYFLNRFDELETSLYKYIEDKCKK